ncbi:hexokinase-1-like protein isoform X1 [Tanacetum coccineum]
MDAKPLGYYPRSLPDVHFITSPLPPPSITAFGDLYPPSSPPPKLYISKTPLVTRIVIVDVCNIIVTRAARLAAAGILGILKKTGRDIAKDGEIQKTVIAVDGGLYEHYTKYRKCMEKTLHELLGDELLSKHIELVHSNDGSGIGAALLGASHSKY